MKLFEEMFDVPTKKVRLKKEAKLPEEIYAGSKFEIKNGEDVFEVYVIEVYVQIGVRPETVIKYTWTKNGKDKKSNEQLVEPFLKNWWGN